MPPTSGVVTTRVLFAIALVVAVASTATAVVVRESREPIAAPTGAALAPSVIGGVAPEPQPVDYGSGTLGPWQDLAHRMSSEDEIRDALMFNGVFLFGDSIALQDCDALERLLRSTSGDALAVRNWSGQPTAAAVDALADWERRFGLPSRIVMAVGTNDIFDPPAFAAQVERAMRIAGPSRTVYWVNVHVGRVRQPADVRAADLANSAWINRQLDEAALRHPNLRIIRWAEFLAADPARTAKYLRDGVHTSAPAGQDARNQLILEALQGK